MEWFFNKEFKSASGNKPFVRIGIKIDINSMFGVQIDDMMEPMRFSKFDYKDSHVNGVSIPAIDFDTFCKEFSGYPQTVKDKYKDCILDLSRAFRAHVSVAPSKGYPLSASIQSEVYSDIIRKRDIILDLCSNKTVETSSTEKEVWKEIDSVGIDDTILMNEIIESVFAHKGKPIQVRDKFYMLKENEAGDELAIFVKTSGSEKTEEKVVEPIKVVPTKKMAFCIDAKGLTNFNKYELYEIVKNQKDYLVVKDIFGDERCMRSQRFRVLDVEEELMEA